MDTTDTDTDTDQWQTGKPSTTIVALPGDAVNESRERFGTAFNSPNFLFSL